MVEVPDRLAPALADLALIGAAARSRRDGGGYLHPELAALLRVLTSVPGTPQPAAGQGGTGDTSPAASPVHIATAGEAARVLGVTPRRVRQLAAAGRLPATRPGHEWRIQLHPEDLSGDAHRPGRAGGDRR